MGNWTLQKKSGGSYVSYPISNVNISLSLSGINIANITTHVDDSGTKINVNDEVVVSYDSNIVFVGFVDTSSQSNKTTYQLTISEKANELQNIYVYKNSSYRVPVDNTDEDVTFAQYISTILNTGVVGHDSGWVDGGNTNVKTSLTIPSTSTHYPSVLFSYSNCYEGLTHMIDDVANVKFRFDYDYTTGTKTLRYGTISSPSDTYTLSTNVVDITNIVITTLDDEDVYDYGLDKVIVVKSGDGSVVGSATVASPSSPPKTVVYQYDNVTDNNEATAMAQAILNQRSASNVIKSVYLPTGFFGVQEGDYVQIGESYYAVTKIQYSINETVIDLNGIYLDVWQQYSQKKRVTSTGVFEGVESTWDGGKQNVDATKGATFTYYVDDISKIGDEFNLILNYDVWDKELSIGNGGYLYLSSDTEYTGIDKTAENNANGVNGGGGASPLHIGGSKIDENQSDFVAYSTSLSTKDVLSGTSVAANWKYISVGVDPDGNGNDLCDMNVNILLDFTTTNITEYIEVKLNVYADTSSPDFTPSSSNLVYTTRQYIHPNILYDGDAVYRNFIPLRFNKSIGSISDTSTVYYKFGIRAYSTYGSITVRWASAELTQYYGHTHTFSPTAHYNDITDETHDHNSNTSHSNHLETTGIVDIGSGCTSPSVVVNGTTFTLTGSGVVDISENIKSELQNGKNTIVVKSTSNCSVIANATYISY